MNKMADRSWLFARTQLLRNTPDARWSRIFLPHASYRHRTQRHMRFFILLITLAIGWNPESLSAEALSPHLS